MNKKAHAVVTARIFRTKSLSTGAAGAGAAAAGGTGAAGGAGAAAGPAAASSAMIADNRPGAPVHLVLRADLLLHAGDGRWQAAEGPGRNRAPSLSDLGK